MSCIQTNVLQCKPSYKTAYRKFCTTVQDTECRVSIESSEQTTYEQQCSTVYENVCTGSGYHKKCSNVPKQQCQQVPKKVATSNPVRNCGQVGDQPRKNTKKNNCNQSGSQGEVPSSAGPSAISEGIQSILNAPYAFININLQKQIRVLNGSGMSPIKKLRP